jgi:hypothetical protein
MARKHKAYTVEYMPEYTSSDDMIAHFQKCHRNCTQERANRLLHNEQQLFLRDRERSRLWHNEERGSWKGRNTRAATALLGMPSEGGKDNLRNFLTSSINDRYLTTAEVEELIESKYGADKVDSKFKRARDTHRQILQFHRSVRRWSAWGKPEPDSADFGPETAGGKYGDRVQLYGLMPRGLKHKPGEEYVAEDSQVLKWMGERSGDTDIKSLEAEFHRLPKANAKDTAEKIAKAVLIHDKETRETIGILTYRAELKAQQEAENKSEACAWPSVTPEQRAIIRSLGLFESKQAFLEEAQSKLDVIEKQARRLLNATRSQDWEQAESETGEVVFAGMDFWRKQEERERRELERRKALEEERQKKRNDQLSAEAEKLKPLPSGSDMYSASDFIASQCDLSKFTWPNILDCARNNGFVSVNDKTGEYCGANNQPNPELTETAELTANTSSL